MSERHAVSPRVARVDALADFPERIDVRSRRSLRWIAFPTQ
jgi:hypothetical protein